MPNIRGLNEDITYWAPGAGNQFGGLTYSAPVLIKGRWEDKQENIIDTRGQTVISRSRVFTEVSVRATGFVAKGDHTAEMDPTEVAGAWEIRNKAEVPDIRNLRKLITIYI